MKAEARILHLQDRLLPAAVILLRHVLHHLRQEAVIHHLRVLRLHLHPLEVADLLQEVGVGN